MFSSMKTAKGLLISSNMLTDYDTIFLKLAAGVPVQFRSGQIMHM